MPISSPTTSSAQHECEHCSFSFVPPETSAGEVVRCPRCWRPVSVSPSNDEPLSIVFKAADSDTASEIDALTSDTSIHSNDALEIQSDDALDELVDTLESENLAFDVDVTDDELEQLTADELDSLGFGHLAPAVEEDVAEESGASVAFPAEPSIQPEPKPKPKRKPARKKKRTDEDPEEASASEQMKRSAASYGFSLLFHLVLMIVAAFIVYHTQDFRWHGEIEGANESIGDGGGLELQAPIEFEAPLPSPDAHLTESVLAGSVGQGFGQARGKGGVGFFGTKARGKSFAFVVDISGSMTTSLPQPPARNRREREEQQPITRWQKAREELMQAIDAMSESQSFAVMLYNDQHHAFLRNGEPVGLMRATRRNKDDVRAWLNSVNAEGGTEPQLSIHEALKLKPEVLFFLTDGIIPAATRETARESNIGKTVIHTTCIGSVENTILQLIANDHGGRFRSVTGYGHSPGSDGVAIVCITSSEESNRLKFKRIEDDLIKLQSGLQSGKIDLRDDRTHTTLILHNAVSDIPKFTLELQRLLKELNSGTKAGFDTQIGSGRLGIDIRLNDLDLRYSDNNIETAGQQKMSIRELLKTIESDEDMEESQAVKTIYVFGDIESKREVLSALEVHNLYNGSVLKLIDGEEFVKKQR